MSDVLLLCYHGISGSWPAPIAVTPSAFERQMKVVAARGYRGTTFTEAIREPPEARSVAVTFDDAYRSVIELALPILARFGFPATVFVTTAHAGREAPMSWPGVDQWLGSPHEDELVPMSWADLGELAEAGWEIGSHTRTHPRLPELDDETLRDELAGSRRDCEDALGRDCVSLAYPYGDHDARVAATAAAAGYAAACGVRPIAEPGSPLRRSRVGIYRGDDLRRFKQKISPTMRRLRAGPAWRLIRLAKRTRQRSAGARASIS